MNAPCLPTTDSTCITEQNWRALETACRKARMHPIQMLKFIAGAAGIPVCRLGRTSLTWKQYQDVMVQLEGYRRRKLFPLPPPAGTEDDGLITEQAWELLQEACRGLGLEQWQAQRVIAEATGIPLADLERGRLTGRQFMKVFGQLEELETARTRPPLSHPPTPLTRPYPQWVDARMADESKKKRSKKSRSTRKDEAIRSTAAAVLAELGIPHWLWDGGFGEE